MGGKSNMAITSDLPYPKDEYVELFKDFYGEINGPDSFDSVKEWASEKWSATVNCSRGKVLEKAGFSRVHLVGGVLNESPGEISLFETLAYPANPRIPGFIIMTNMNTTEAMGNVLVFYTDLIIQDSKSHDQEKQLFSNILKDICEHHEQDFGEHNSTMTGRGLLGGNGGECGLMNFFEEKDISFLESVIDGILSVYKNIIEKAGSEKPRKEDYEHMHQSRARLIEWIILEDYGVQVARENGIRSEVVEAYGFPPQIRY
jgi:coproporphyrinogen III oxidase